MKKLLLSLLLAGVALGAKAQPAADDTFFWSLNVGGNYYSHSGESSFSAPTAGLNVGWWIMKPLAFRIGADMSMARGHQYPDDGNATFLFASAEFMWDVNATFFHVYNKTFLSPIPIYPMIGLGLAMRPTGGLDNDFQAMLGFQAPVRFAPTWDAFLEYKCFFLPQSFDASKGDNFMHTFTLGITHRWSDSPFGRRTEFETRSNDEDWFVGFGAGANFSSFEFEYVANPDARLWNFSPELMFGRNYSNVWTIRFELSGFFARERAITHEDNSVSPGNWYMFNNLHTDFMINLTHLANFRRGQKWNFMPYLGAGPVWRYGDAPKFHVAADAGLFIRRFIDNAGDFYIDLKYIMVPPRVAGNTGPSGSILGVGYPSITFGYIHNFGRSTTRFRQPVNDCPTNQQRY